MVTRKSGGAIARLFGASLVMQAMLSAANFLVGLILIRHTSNLQYGYFVLATNVLLLATGIQTAFIQPHMVLGLTRLELQGRRDLIGGVLRLRRRALPPTVIGGLLLTYGLHTAKLIGTEVSLIAAATLLALLATLGREFFRLALFAHHRPQDVLKADSVYVVLLISGVFAATMSAFVAVIAIAAVGCAAIVGRTLLARALWRHEAWNIAGAPDILKDIGSLGIWSTAGSAIHWALSQGYNYLVAGTLDVEAVASIAITRLLMMPVNLLSAGIGTLLFPLTSKWMRDLGLLPTLRRLIIFALGVVGAALLYFAAMWLLRGWIFTEILKKQVEQRDALLLLWCAVFTLMLIRDQLVNILTAREQFRRLTTLTGISAAISLIASYAAMLRYGVSGAVAGVLIGELCNVIGIVVLIVIETKRPPPATTGQPLPPPDGLIGP